MIALRQQAMHRFLLACTLCLASIGANATEDGCAVVLKTPDGFLALREGPGNDFPVIAKLSPGTFLYTDTRSYYEIGKRTGFADRKKWTTASPIRLRGVDGWVSTKYIL